ncbi:DUF5134 domain-containing protein [Streptomyces sp. 8K308]|uniref:DUF5134 domain-containing protein n=1 Tax=Streptomyces sp. 8K308 TaxID=2530388 RepID=UPI0010451274|nr:DUF5134 domain-containing protein [Streptomyces sp. 8K308]TDC25047.1 DUF5134 domain-containing protein [Streptomyces sp. 8K308]
MHGPALVGWLMVALCGATGGYCLLLVRGAAGRPRRAVAVAEGAMGLGMAAMAVPAAPPWPAAPALPLLCAATALGGAALLAVRGPAHRGHHLVEAAAMLYMVVAMAAAPASHSGHATPTGLPALTGALLLYFAGYALRTAPRLLPAAGAAEVVAAGPPDAGRSPEVAAACRLALAVAMVAMLIGL